MKTVPEVPTKKLYSPPQPSNYGDLVSITATFSMTAKNMDGGANNTKSG